MALRTGAPIAIALNAFLVLAAAAGPAGADALPPPVSDSELDHMRGGFDVGGLTFNFGADLTATINGHVYQSQLTWTPDGAQLVSGPGGQVQTQTGANGVNQTWVLNNGQTVLIQNTVNGVQNIVLNQASGQQINLATQLHLSLPGFAQTQQTYQQNVTIAHIMGALGALGSGLGH